MRAILLTTIALGTLLLWSAPRAITSIPPPPPLAPEAGGAHAPTAMQPDPVEPASTGVPSLLTIPSLRLSARIVPVGINEKGEMDVPDGSTTDVGWYQYGTLPGNAGSAVMDAHVYAAFKQLNKLQAGDDLYVTAENGSIAHFRVQEIETYAYDGVPRELLFNRKDGSYLNLITCAGSYSKKLKTYTKRLVVYAALVTR